GHRAAAADRVHDIIADHAATGLVALLGPRHGAGQRQRTRHRKSVPCTTHSDGDRPGFTTLHHATSLEINAAKEHLSPALAARIRAPERPGVIVLLGLS